MSDELLLRVGEAAERLRIARSTLYEAMRRGEIESVRIGTARRISVDALNAYVRSLRE